MATTCEIDQELRETRARARKCCAISYLPLALAERVVDIGQGLWVDGELVSAADRLDFESELKRLNDLRRERNDLQFQIDHLQSDLDELKGEIALLSAQLGVP